MGYQVAHYEDDCVACGAAGHHNIFMILTLNIGWLITFLGIFLMILADKVG